MTTPFQRPQQHPAAWVTEGLPGALKDALVQRGGIPHRVRELVLDQLQYRTATELRDRIERRWFLRFSNLTGPEIAQRADTIVYELLAAGDCTSLHCEDGWLRDDSGSCPKCRKNRSQFNMRPEDLAVDRRASPEFAAQVAAALRQERRQKYGMPRSTRSRHVVKQFTDHAPAPYTLREPEPEVPSEELIAQARRAEENRRAQRLAEERAKAERAARAKKEGRA